MIKILQIGMSDTLGGIEVYLINLLRNIDKQKFQIDFIKMGNKNLCFEDEIKEKYKSVIYQVPDYTKHPFSFTKKLKKIINDNKYDIIYLNKNSLAVPFQLIAAKESNTKKIIIHSHSTSSNNKTIGNILHRINRNIFLSNKFYYFSCSESASKWFFTDKIINSSNHFLINNSIDMSRFFFNESTRKKIRKEYNINEDTIIIGHVGRFARAKNHEFLIEIFNDYHKKNTNSVLWLIGIGELQNKIIEKVNDLNLKNVVTFFNQRSDVFDLLNAMDCFVFPSFYEGLPLTVIEAQTSGVKCLLSDNIDHNSKIVSTTEFIDINNVNDWSSQILKNINRTSISKEALNSNYNIKNEIKKIETILNTISSDGKYENENDKQK